MHRMLSTKILHRPCASNAIVMGMNTSLLRGLVIAALAWNAPAWAQSIRIVKFAEGKPFQMGKVTSRRIVHPDLGAKRLTLNYSVSQNGSEFAQHVHDGSDDT